MADEDVAQIRALTEEWVRASLAGDWSGVAALLTDDAVLLPPDHPIVEGRAAATAYLEAFPTIRSFTSDVVAADGRGDFAWARGTFVLGVEPEPGQTQTLRGKWSATYRKGADGRWLGTSDTWNLDAPASDGA
jgi:uncharacterized protein (TIGR02246 family)